MKGRSYRKYTEEFRLQALELAKSSGKSLEQIERDLGITRGLLQKWQERYKLVENGSQPAKLVRNDLAEAKAEIRRLQRELAIAEEEREILKKAVTIFSKTGE